MMVLVLLGRWQNSDSNLSHLLRVGALLLLDDEMLEILIFLRSGLG